MLASLCSELREIAWLTWVAGSLTIAGAMLAIAATFALELLA